jgi:hypothetical protein
LTKLRNLFFNQLLRELQYNVEFYPLRSKMLKYISIRQNEILLIFLLFCFCFSFFPSVYFFLMFLKVFLLLILFAIFVFIVSGIWKRYKLDRIFPKPHDIYFFFLKKFTYGIFHLHFNYISFEIKMRILYATIFPTIITFNSRKMENGVIEWLMFNVNSAISQLYHGENKFIFNEMMMRSALC